MKKKIELWPAIDLINGKPVRLKQGDFQQKTEFNFNLPFLTKTFNQFASGIHIVDLDGAKNGKPQNLEAVKIIIQNAKIPIEFGGGIRSLKDAQQIFNLGVSRIILGTSAINNINFFDKLLKKYGNKKIILGVDAKNGFVATHGWQKTSSIQVIDFIKQFINNDQKNSIQTIIFTDILTDGTMQGPPLTSFKKLITNFPQINFIASGGVSNISDIKNLEKTGVQGIVFGRAFYEGKITIQELQNITK